MEKHQHLIKKNDCSIVTVKKITSSNHIIMHEWNMRKCVLQNCTGTSDMSSPEQALTPHMIQAPDMSTKLENIRGPKKKKSQFMTASGLQTPHSDHMRE